MTGFRSLTDEQLAERHDPTPWCHDDGEGRTLRYASITETPTINGSWHDPRVECIPSRDPEPWHEGDQWFPGPRHAQNDPPGPDDVAEWAPRPEFARPPVNHILSLYRAKPELFGSASSWAAYACHGTHCLDDELLPGEADHARKVLTRLAVVFA